MSHRLSAHARSVAFCCIAALLFASGAASAAKPVDFVRDIQPILRDHCVKCHGPKKQEGGVRWDRKAWPFRAADSGHIPIVAGKPADSVMLKMIRGDGEKQMPPEGEPLTEKQISLIETWIAQGANWPDGVDPVYDDLERHWSFVKPKRHEPPAVKHKDWPRNFIDQFILARLEKEGFAPSQPADRHVLIRRVSLDLTGLPPTPREVEAFVNDDSPDAYEKLVDRLLASSRFGERWAAMWLDLARYADSAGYGSDPLRPYMWPYRDWVINAFNENMPYDQFTLEQLAGDLLPNATPDQRLASSMHRNTMTNTEGGTDDEEFRIAAVKDRAVTTMQAWMGLTLGCAECHTHKYDPITQREYYQFFAYFNQTADTDKNNDEPREAILTPLQREKIDRLQQRITELKKQPGHENGELLAAMNQWADQAGGATWQPLKPAKMESTGGATLSLRDDDSIVVSGINPDKDTYNITVETNLRGITGLRVEALPDDSLADNGPGRAANGNFVLSEFDVEAAPLDAAARRGRYVRVLLPGKQRLLHLAEVQVYSAGQNIATDGKASASSVDYDGAPERAIDGNTDGHYFNGQSVQHNAQEDNPWWEVDLGAERPIEKVVVFNRTDGGGGITRRLDGAVVKILDEARRTIWQTTLEKAPEVDAALNLSEQAPVVLAHASADHEQDDNRKANPYRGWVAKAAIDDDVEGAQWGWAVAGQFGKAHQIVFETESDIDFEGGARLALTLHQNYGSNHTLGRFRISATTGPRPQRVFPPAVADALDTPREKRSDEQIDTLLTYYTQHVAPPTKIMRQIAALQKQIDKIKATKVPVMVELPADKQRDSYILIGGNFLNRGEQVKAGMPAAFAPMPKGAPSNRIGVARWLTHPDNPLTARVAVNRFWARLFGKGIVESEEDFGTQGKLPTHPKLLDTLAVDFMQKGWDVKRLLKQIVMSATYRQSSVFRDELREADPRTRLLARYPRRRLTAEQVRDQALALSGQLSDKIGGPSVYPPQPPGLWQAAFNGQRNYPTSEGEDRYRRGVYTFWRRTTPHPSMATFDVPSRELCTMRREPTNTPLQAFVTLNDPIYIELARALAVRIMREGGDDVTERIRWALKLCTARPPSESQVDALVKLYQSQLAHYTENPSAARELISSGYGSPPEDLDEAEHAAWTVVANTLLNTDAVLTRS